MPKFSANSGYTFIELLVVIGIIAILSVIAFVNIKDFSSKQAVNKAAGEIQSFLRLAQSNATSSTNCAGAAVVNWAVRIYKTDENNSGVDILCNTRSSEGEVLPLDPNQPSNSQTLSNIQITVNGNTCDSLTGNCLLIIYSGRSGAVNFVGQGQLSDPIIIQLTSTKTNAQKSFNLSKGGAINVQ